LQRPGLDEQPLGMGMKEGSVVDIEVLIRAPGPNHSSVRWRPNPARRRARNTADIPQADDIQPATPSVVNFVDAAASSVPAPAAADTGIVGKAGRAEGAVDVGPEVAILAPSFE